MYKVRVFDVFNMIGIIYFIVIIIEKLYQIIQEKRKKPQNLIEIRLLWVELHNYFITLLFIIMSWSINRHLTELINFYFY